MEDFLGEGEGWRVVAALLLIGVRYSCVFGCVTGSLTVLQLHLFH